MNVTNYRPSADAGVASQSISAIKINGFFSRFLLAISGIFSSISNFFHSLSPWKNSPKVTHLPIDRKNDQNSALTPSPQPKLQDSSKKVDNAASPYIFPPALRDIHSPISKIEKNVPLTWEQTISENKVALLALTAVAVVAAGTFYLATCYSRKEIPSLETVKKTFSTGNNLLKKTFDANVLKNIPAQIRPASIYDHVSKLALPKPTFECSHLFAVFGAFAVRHLLISQLKKFCDNRNINVLNNIPENAPENKSIIDLKDAENVFPPSRYSDGLRISDFSRVPFDKDLNPHESVIIPLSNQNMLI
ncbi:MAG: hypothetical protein H0U49_10175, partial [Parachlamydiaceae bacterium]|nr:hypothetical protein [Parachlamydiaceae bacterium]